MTDHIKNKLNSLSSSGNSAERTESKKPKVVKKTTGFSGGQMNRNRLTEFKTYLIIIKNVNSSKSLGNEFTIKLN